MKIKLANGKVMNRRFVASGVIGYVAKTIEMDADDIRRMRDMALGNPFDFLAMMEQLQARFQSERPGNGGIIEHEA